MLLVEHILDAARKRLATLSLDSGLCDAAEILMNAATPLVVVCDGDGVAVGVVTRSDIMKALVDARADAHNTRAGALMTRNVLTCREGQPLEETWKAMSARSLRCVPVLDDAGKPQGVLHARDLASALLDDVAYEEHLLRDYVMGVGYQ